MKTVLITGAAGFIGPQLVKLFLTKTDFRVLVLDKLTYAGNPKSLEMVLKESQSMLKEGGRGWREVSQRYVFVNGDICDLSVKGLIEAWDVEWLVNLAAESHVDRSIGSAPEFLRTEVQGALNLLEIVRRINDPTREQSLKIEKTLFVGTDEVYGSIDRLSGREGNEWYELARDEAALKNHIEAHLFKEEHRLQPGSPYASTKAAADLLVMSYHNTWPSVPALITRGVNNFGPFQHPEKLLPLAICTLLKPRREPDGTHPGYDRRIPIYDHGLAVREWLHTEDHAQAMLTVLEKGKQGQVYSVGSGNRCLNRDMLIAVFKAAKKMGSDSSFGTLAEACFEAARPGHDLCYAIDASKLQGLGWNPTHSDLEREVVELVEWYASNPEWWQPVWDSLEFENYWQSKYGEKMKMFGRKPYQFYNDQEYARPLNSALL